MQQPELKTIHKKLIDVDGLKFKDLNDNGKLDPYEDWRLSPEERAKDLCSQMNLDEKVGMLLIHTRKMGLSQEDKSKTSHDGIIDEEVVEKGRSIFAGRKTFGTTETIERLKIRHFILRCNWSPSEMAIWINKVNEICEKDRLGIPCLIASNSRNEHTEFVFGMNDAGGIFSTWPGTLGLAAAVKGELKDKGESTIIEDFAKAAHKEWLATGIRKGYMYMADVVTDPRWQRTYGTFGEDPEFIADVIGKLIDGFQGDKLDDTSISLTVKHFPGGGPRENGFDPHYVEGKWNCYPTKGSMEKYHLPPFVEAVKHQPGSIMPYYSAPAIEKSSYQKFDGEDLQFDEVGFAFNYFYLQEILRDKLGFEGYVNSDSGITDNMCWGVEDLTTPARFAKAINAGTDLIADTNNAADLKAAIEQDMISIERIDEAVQRVLKEMFVLGIFDHKTYVDPDKADKVVKEPKAWEQAYDAHKKSITLVKNTAGALPIGDNKKVFIKCFHKDPKVAAHNEELAKKEAKQLGNIQLVDDPKDCDLAALFLSPRSGDYFSATLGYLELKIGEDIDKIALDGTPYKETTLTGIDELKDIAKTVKDNGGKVAIGVNVILPWILEGIEPLADALLLGYDSFYKAYLEVITGTFKPVGVLPLTLPKSDDVIAVDEDGNCVSPNDVPGYDKDQYMPDGMTYAYKDADGNEYKLGFGLRY